MIYGSFSMLYFIHNSTHHKKYKHDKCRFEQMPFHLVRQIHTVEHHACIAMGYTYNFMCKDMKQSGISLKAYSPSNRGKVDFY